MTPPIFRPLSQPETRFADEKVVTQLNAQQDGLFWLVWKSCFNLVRSTKISALPKILQRYINHVTRRLGLNRDKYFREIGKDMDLTVQTP